MKTPYLMAVQIEALAVTPMNALAIAEELSRVENRLREFGGEVFMRHGVATIARWPFTDEGRAQLRQAYEVLRQTQPTGVFQTYGESDDLNLFLDAVITERKPGWVEVKLKASGGQYFEYEMG